MELRLKGYGSIEITNATLVDGGDILIKSADNFRKIQEITDCEIDQVYLAEVDFSWSLVAFLTKFGYMASEYDSFVCKIENQDDIYKLNAFL